MSAHARRRALDEADLVRSWTCQSCDTMVQGEGDHCRACTAYWADVAAGLFDDIDDEPGDEPW